MKFKKSKIPKPLNVTNKVGVTVDNAGRARLSGFAFEETMGPRMAIKMAKWLERYAKWSSLQ